MLTDADKQQIDDFIAKMTEKPTRPVRMIPNPWRDDGSVFLCEDTPIMPYRLSDGSEVRGMCGEVRYPLVPQDAWGWPYGIQPEKAQYIADKLGLQLKE
jgi:hypothetical protein